MDYSNPLQTPELPPSLKAFNPKIKAATTVPEKQRIPGVPWKRKIPADQGVMSFLKSKSI